MNNQLKQPTTKSTKVFPFVVICIMVIIPVVLYYLYREPYVVRRVSELKGITVHSNELLGKPKFIEKMHGLKRVIEIEVNSPHLTEEDMKLFGQCKYLKDLTLVSDNITDDWLRHLTHLKKLYLLRIYSENITDEGLKHLSKISSLGAIIVRSSSIEGPGLFHLKEMTNLHAVSILSKKFN